MKYIQKQKGFTLIELLVVIAIIGMLASVVLISLNVARRRGRDAKRLANIHQISTALDIYYNSCKSYPVTTTPLTLDGQTLSEGTATDCGNNKGGNATDGGFNSTGGNQIMAVVPAAATPPDGDCSTSGPSSSDSNPYIYTSYSDDGTTASTSSDTAAAFYKITFCTGGDLSGTSGGNHTLSPNGVQ